MSAVWFVGFSIAWTGLLSAGAHILTRDRVIARHAHNLWRGAAALSLLPWLIVAISAILPTSLATPIPDLPYLGNAAEAISNTPALQVAARTASSSVFATVLTALLVAGWGLRFVGNILCQIRLQHIKKTAVQTDKLTATTWAKRLGLKYAPSVRLIPRGSPFLAGIRQRTIYLPESVADPINSNVIFAHECTHLARGDLYSRPLERLVAEIFWFSPFAWAMRRQLDYWREAACDEQTASLTGDSVAYAKALATTARLTRPMPRYELPVAAFILPQPATLKRRLTQLLEPQAHKPKPRLTIAAIILGLVLAPVSLAHGMSLVDQSVFSHAIIMDSHATISSPYGNRYYPDADKEWWHSGVDIKAPEYTYIYAPADAKVLTAMFKNEYGKTVDILLPDGRKMRFSQMSHIFVEKGDKIYAGDKIGKVGASGANATGPHLHLELFADGEHQDPERARGLMLIEG